MFLCSATSLCPCFVSMDGPSLDLCVRGCKRAVCFSVIGHLKEGAAQLESTLKVTTLFSTQLSFLMNILPRCGFNMKNVTYFLKWLQNDTAKDLIILEMRTLIHQGKHPTMKLLLHMLW